MFYNFTAYEHARVVFTISDGENLFSYQAIKDMCLIQERLENLAEYKDVCDKQDNACCPPWSLVNYITLMKKHMSCSEIIVISTLFLLLEIILIHTYYN